MRCLRFSRRQMLKGKCMTFPCMSSFPLRGLVVQGLWCIWVTFVYPISLDVCFFFFACIWMLMMIFFADNVCLCAGMLVLWFSSTMHLFADWFSLGHATRIDFSTGCNFFCDIILIIPLSFKSYGLPFFFAALVCFKPLSLFFCVKFYDIFSLHWHIVYMVPVVLLHYLRLFNIRCSWFHGFDLILDLKQ